MINIFRRNVRSLNVILSTMWVYLAFAFTAMGDSQITIKGVTLHYSITNDGVVMGTGSIAQRAVNYSYDGGLVIPNEINGLKVVGISDYAFYGCQVSSIKIPSTVQTIGISAFDSCKGLSTIALPSGLREIGARAFYGCSGLSSISVPSGVETIGDEAFMACAALEEINVEDSNCWYSSANGLLYDKNQLELIRCPVSKHGVLSVPATVTNICDYACYGCGNLTSLIIPQSVVRVGKWSFGSCRGLLGISLSRGVEYIDDNAFEMCSGLQEITIPGSVKRLGKESFCGCTQLTKAVLEEGILTIDYDAFYACGNFSEFNIPKSVVDVGPGSFGTLQNFPEGIVIVDGCVLGVNGKVSGRVEIPMGTRMVVADAFRYQDLEEIVLPEGLTKVDGFAFQCCDKLKHIVISDSDTSVAANAFAQCANVESVEMPLNFDRLSDIFPDSYKNISSLIFCGGDGKIAKSAFAECTNLALIDLTKTRITSVGSVAFGGCGKLHSIDLPNTVTEVGEYAFYGCSELTNVVLRGRLENIGSSAFEGCSSLAQIAIPEGVKYLGEHAFSGCYNLTNISMGVGVEHIGAEAFSECKKLVLAEMPDGVKDIGDQAFYRCWSLKSVGLPEGITNIGTSAFRDCHELESVVIPSTIKSMGACIFQSSGVKSVVINEGVAELSRHAFDSCWRLKMVAIPRSMKVVGECAFSGCEELSAVMISDLDAWCNIRFFDLDSNPLSKAGRLYLNGTQVTRITLSSALETINNYVFSGFKELVSVDIPDGVKSIGVDAFYGCASLKVVSVPTTVTEIESGAFCGCTALAILNMPRKMSKIGNGAFCNCGALTEVAVPEGVEIIEYRTFAGCYRLRRISIPMSVREIDDTAFEGCSLEVVCLPANVSGMGSVPSRHIAICDGETSIPDYKFCNSEIEKIDIPEGVVEIGKCAFQYCHKIVSLVIPSTVETMESAFETCCGLESVKFNPGVRNISDSAFYGCSRLCSLELPSSVTNIGRWAFSETALKALVIPNRVVQIGACSFRECTSLETVTIPPSVQLIGTSAFYGCREDLTVVVMCDDKTRVSEMLQASGFDVSRIKWVEKVLPPVITPEDLTRIQGAVKVSLTSMLDGGVVHYTVDGSDPTIESPVFKKFSATGKMTIKAITEYDGQISEVAVSRIALGKCERPCIRSSQGAQFSQSGNVVIITCETDGVEIRYTTDGSEPTINSPSYSGPFEISETTKIRAMALNHVDYFDSDIAEESFTREWIRVGPPTIDAPASFVGKSTKVVMDCALEGATIYYTTDGSDPAVGGKVYSGELDVTGTITIRAIATKADCLNSYETVWSIVKEWTYDEALNVEGLGIAIEEPDSWVYDNQTTHDGAMSLRSGVMADNGATALRFEVNGGGKLSFWWKASCEDTDLPQVCWWDYGSVSIDGTERAWIDGETDWQYVEINVSGNDTHEIVWRYAKDSDGADGQDCIWVDEVAWTPCGLLDDLTQLQEVFGSESEVAKNITSDAELALFNSFISSCGVTSSMAMTEGQKRWAYQSFKLSEITVAPMLCDEKPELQVETFEPDGANWSLSVSLTAGNQAIEMAKDKLKERIWVGTSLDGINAKPNILTEPSADGSHLRFTVEMPMGPQGFVRVRID